MQRGKDMTPERQTWLVCAMSGVRRGRRPYLARYIRAHSPTLPVSTPLPANCSLQYSYVIYVLEKKRSLILKKKCTSKKLSQFIRIYRMSCCYNEDEMHKALAISVVPCLFTTHILLSSHTLHSFYLHHRTVRMKHIHNSYFVLGVELWMSRIYTLNIILLLVTTSLDWVCGWSERATFFYWFLHLLLKKSLPSSTSILDMSGCSGSFYFLKGEAVNGTVLYASPLAHRSVLSRNALAAALIWIHFMTFQNNKWI